MHAGIRGFLFRLWVCLAILGLASATWSCDGVEPPWKDGTSDRGASEPDEDRQDKPSYTRPEKRTAYGADVRCYDSFDKFKRAKKKQGMGNKGRDYHWHHVVPQHADNKSKFKEHNLHCTDNLVYIHKDEHTKLNRFYSETNDELGGKSFRDWLKPKDFAEQHAHGIAAMRQLEIEVTENPGVPY